ncbi:MAG: hypothetical protein JSW47_13215 [Phycisphaerales bacterium]|nr:MAG: hypothetical protein JSW47_13215 [Phycisphaerales bacterium]
MENPHRKLIATITQNRSGLALGQIAFLLLYLCSLAQAEVLTLPIDERPTWLQRDGIVMAGSWEPLLFRVRRDGYEGYTPTAEQRNAYLREHSPEMIARLKDLGVNFVMMHCYKGAGLAAERESMADAVEFSRLCHEAGLRVGVYNYSGAFLWELLFKEIPQAENWVLLDENGTPRTYGSATYRYRWDRNHPDAQAFYRKIVSFAVNEIKADLLHFDNYGFGPGRDINSARRFRKYLRDTFTPGQLGKAGIDEPDAVQPPMTGPPDNLLRQAWLEFCCRSLADSYHEMSRYARTLRKDILIECNPGGPGTRIRPPVDHGRLLQGGEAFWDEGREPGYRNGQLHTRIRTYKVARNMNNMAFAYTTTPLEMAESMAFNLDCLGCICWFEYAEIVAKPGSKNPMSAALVPFIQFFHTRRDLFRDANVLADVAVLRSFPSQVFADAKYAGLTHQVEQTLIDNHVCFEIVYSQQLDNLEHYRVLVLAGCVSLSDQHIEQIEQYVRSGGRICIIGPVAIYDQWMRPRAKPVFSQLPYSEVIRIPSEADILSTIRRACDNELTLSIDAGPGLCSELTEQPGKRLVHLVNYRQGDPIRNVLVDMRLPAGCRVQSVQFASPERDRDIESPFDDKGGRIRFSVPAVGVYEIAVIKTK